jgi:hypothetical protein
MFWVLRERRASVTGRTGVIGLDIQESLHTSGYQLVCPVFLQETNADITSAPLSILIKEQVKRICLLNGFKSADIRIYMTDYHGFLCRFPHGGEYAE